MNNNFLFPVSKQSPVKPNSKPPKKIIYRTKIRHPSKRMRVACIMFYDDGCKEYGDINYEINRRYCQKYNIALIKSSTRKYQDGRHPTWERFPLLLQYLPYYEYVIWIDADAFFYLSKNIHDLIGEHRDKEFIFSDDVSYWEGNQINAGFFITKNTPNSLHIVNTLANDKDLYQTHEHGWKDQGAINELYQKNTNELQSRSVCIPFRQLQDFCYDDAEPCYVCHLAGQASELRIQTAQTYLDKITGPGGH